MQFDSEKKQLTIGVRELCRLAYTSGDIDAHRAPTEFDVDNHRLIESHAENGALIECPLDITVPYLDFEIHIRGRADIIHAATNDGEKLHPAEVEEIKTVPPQMLGGAPAEIHSAQVKLYALMLAEKDRLTTVGCRLTYASPDGKKTRSFVKLHTADELRFYLAATLERASFRLCDERDRVLVRRASIGSMRFPYRELREGQEELINSVYSAIKKKQRLFAEAPTGIGKTVSTLYGAVRAVGKGFGERIFYLTAKASTRREAFRAAAALSGAGLTMRTIVLYSREQCCINPIAAAAGGSGSLYCHPGACPYAAGYFDRRDAVIRSLTERYRGFTRNAVMTAASASGVCPYELSLDLSELCDIIICDYNYVFDPAVRLRRFFGSDAGADDSIILVDEAHNLPERARDIYSAEFNTAYLSDFAAYLPSLGEKISKSAEELSKCLSKLKALCADNLYKNDNGTDVGYYVGREIPPGIGEKLSALGEACDAFLRTNTYGVSAEASPAIRACSQMARLCRRWRATSEEYDDRYRTYIDVSGGNILVRQYCLDPSAALNAAMDKIRAAVFFSATLTPAEYFSDILGGGRNHVSLSLASPFPAENLFLAAISSVSTRYDDREKSAGRMATVIAAAASAHRGNYIVYFPSYSYLDAVFDKFTKKHPGVKVIRQTPHMSPSERYSFIAFFGDDTGTLRIGFCVLGGSFSEGVDLPGNRLIGVIIAGVGLPGLSFERNLIRDYYENKVEDGYNYAYTYPGMNRVLQAAGRVIRRSDDRGVVILADDRYTAPPYTALYPPHWKRIRRVDDLADLPRMLREFWAASQSAPES